MSGIHVAISPRAPRAHHHPSSRQPAQPSSTSTTTSNNNSNNRGQRRHRGNRNHNPNQATAQQLASNNALYDAASTESALISGEDMTAPVGPRQPKKHTRSQPSVDRVFSPTGARAASMTDPEQLATTHSMATPAKTQGAYAGPTFHASPAPSALPIPKFLSKSVPPKTHSGPPTPPPDEGFDSASSPSPSPSRGASIPIPFRQDNLSVDLLFKADRDEKARNVHGGPPAAAFSPPNAPSAGLRPQHVKHDSFGSSNVPFPIELEAGNRPSRHSPPVASPANSRSVTAPSRVTPIEAPVRPTESDPIQDLMSRLSLSQSKKTISTPPRNASSGPAMPNQSPSPFYDGRPSPFRSASGPTTPAPPAPMQDGSELLYGNQNLSNKFKAAKADPAARNSGLRTEITADSPLTTQGAFPPGPFTKPDTRSIVGIALNGSGGPRRGSAQHIAPIPPYRGGHGAQHVGSPNRRSHHARPDVHNNGKTGGSLNSLSSSSPSSVQRSTTAMAFIPSSVRAKPPPTPPKKSGTDTLALEQNLKRMLNLAGDPTGVR